MGPSTILLKVLEPRGPLLGVLLGMCWRGSMEKDFAGDPGAAPWCAP